MLFDRTYKEVASTNFAKDIFEVNEIEFSADSKLLYVVGQRLDKVKEWGQIEVVDVDSLEFLSLHKNGEVLDLHSKYNPYIGHTENAMKLAIDHHNGRLASGGLDALTSVFDIDSGACIYTLDQFSHIVRSVSFSHKGEFIAAGDGYGVVKDRDVFSASNLNKYSLVIADAANGEVIHDLKPCLGIQTLRWSPTDNVLAYLHDNLPPSVTGVGNMMMSPFGERSSSGQMAYQQGEVRIIGA